MYDPLIHRLVKLLLSQYWLSLHALMGECLSSAKTTQYSSFFFSPARSDQEEREQGAGGVSREDGQGQHPEAGDRGEREPAEHGAG